MPARRLRSRRPRAAASAGAPCSTSPSARRSPPKPACWATTRSAAARSPTTASAMPAPTTPRPSATTSCARSSTTGPTSRGQSLGNWVALLPTKMGGGTYAIDLNSNRVLGSIWYWNYGDYNPISHHLCAFPSADPLHGFEFVNSTQGGQNSLIYGMNTAVTAETVPEGTNIYRVRYNGTQMELIENVSESTGLGLGVHVTVNPKDAQSYFVTDGQKDIAACFDRTTSKVKAALRFDWTPNVADLREAWIKGGTLTIKTHLSRSQDRPVRLQGHQGQQDRLGNGADGRAVRRRGLAARRRPAVADRRRRHDLASRGPLGGHRRAAVRRHRHPRSREELRAGGVPAVQQGLAGPVSGARRSTRTPGRWCSTRSIRRATRSASRPTASSW